jgi:cyclomaltodextrinase
MPLTPRARLALLLLVIPAACARAGDPASPEPGPAPPEDGIAFRYTPPAGAPAVASVHVAGGFNGWSAGATPMARQADGSWLARLRLEDGRHEYKFVINDAWPADMCSDATWGDPARDRWVDPAALGCVPDGQGGQNAVIAVGPATPDLGVSHVPGSAAHVSAAGGRLSIRFQAGHGLVLDARVVAGGRSEPMHVQLSHGLLDVWRGTLPEGTATYALSVRTAEGTRELGPFAVPAEPFRAVPWVGGSIGYQVFPERFWNGDPGNDRLGPETDAHPFMHADFRGDPPLLTGTWDGPPTAQHCCHQYFGGDLQGIIDRLDHLQSLGVTLVYLNPIFSAGSAHGYDTFDYLAVEPGLGDERVLAALRDAARARGIRLMWDFVPNHVGVGHAAFQDAVRNGPASPHWDWFAFRVPAGEVQVGNGRHYASWQGYGSLPELQTRNPAVLAHLMGVVRRWTEFGFDGIRVDVPFDIDNREEFFHALRRTARSIDPEAYLVGEVWQRAPGWLQGDQFDALMNYAIGRDVLLRYARGELAAGPAAGAMARLYAEYPEASAAMQFNVIATHDTERLLTGLGGGGLGAVPSADALARQRLASAMLYALPGVPVTFQGDECAFLGASGGRDEHRYPVQWQACDAGMLAHYRLLARLRRDVPALSSPVIRLAGGPAGVLSWLRGEPGAGEVLALFNAGPTAVTVPLPAGSWTDAASGDVVAGSAAVDARGWRYLARR